MTNPDRDPEQSSAAESGSGASEPPVDGYDTPAYGQPPAYPPPPPGYEQPGYQDPGYPQPGYQQPGYPPPPGYQPYGSFGAPYDTSGGYPPPPPGYPPYGAAPYGAAPYGAAPYGAAPYGAAPYGAAPRTNPLAIWSLVASLIGFVCCLGSVAGIVLGVMSLNQIKQKQEEGQGLAIAGIAVGAVSLIAGLAMAVLVANS
ncbi:DUF4190 domain-containing protein [Mycolicibacterium baixiangningiae]|uniref:DUF4190 domain-containing protein n=1 Tax=Mycolicibacterium baixiangningiae TaxID=2761578 RepID=UPI0018665057|nr:DUF4190 domain-containing protein [Mycolicibacterium baixiangningiae]